MRSNQLDSYILFDLDQLSDKRVVILIIMVSIALFIPYLGNVHLFDWDEINFAEATREMLVSGNYTQVQINYKPFWEKPPLFFWMQALCMNIFGVNEFAARFPNAICGAISLICLYFIGKKVHGKKFGIIWVIIYACSILPHFYFKSGIIDPWFNLFIFLGIFFIYLFNEKSKNERKNIKYLLIGGIMIGLGTLTKGPVAILLFGMTAAIYILIRRFKTKFTILNLMILALPVLTIGSLWILGELIDGRGYIIIDFILYQLKLLQTEDAGHGGNFLYHPIVLLIGCFPASIFFIKYFFNRSIGKNDFALWMKILFFVVLVVFSIVQTKIIHYSSLAYFPLTFLAALVIKEIIQGNLKLKLWSRIMIISIASIVAIPLMIIPFIDKMKGYIINESLIDDPFALANFEATGGWLMIESVVGLLFLAGIIIGIIQLKRSAFKGILIILVSSGLMINLVLTLYVPKIEKYTQGAAIEFYESKSNEDCYIETLNFKSYAHYYYSKKGLPSNPIHSDVNALLTSKIDKPAYFVTKNIYEKEIDSKYPTLVKLYSKNGFVFYKRNKE